MRERGAEQPDDGVADVLLDRAAVVLQLPPHVPPVRILQRAHILGIQPLRLTREPDQVGEQYAHKLPLLAHGRLSGQRGAARVAEASLGTILLSATSARDHSTSLGRRLSCT